MSSSSGGDEAEADNHSSCSCPQNLSHPNPLGGDSCYSSSAASSPLPQRLTLSPDAGYYSPETTLNRSNETEFHEEDSVEYVQAKSLYSPSSIAKRRPLSGSLLSLTASSDHSDSTEPDFGTKLNRAWLQPLDFDILPPKIPFGAQRIPSTVPYRDLPIVKDPQNVRSSTPASMGQSMVYQPRNKLQRSPSIDALTTKASRHRDDLSDFLDLYESLQLEDDEDLMLRAERRDLPECFQRSWASRSSDDISSPCEIPLSCSVHQQRAPPSRRSAIPDRILDDLAARRFSNNQQRSVPKDYEPRSPDSIPLPKGHNLPQQSYLRLTPLFTPPMVCPCTELMNVFEEPDAERDDVLYRSIKNRQWKSKEKQPPMGIPLNGQGTPPLTRGHYLTASKNNMRIKYKTRPTTTADPVQDDMAVRRLRKDTLDSAKFIQITRV